MQLLLGLWCRFGDRPYVGPSLAGNGGVARARANRASSCQISLVHEGDVFEVGQPAGKSSQAAVPLEAEAAQSILGPMGSLGLGEN